MKVNHRTVFLVLLLLVTGPFVLRVTAQDRGAGFGLIMGEPTGLCGKLWVGPATAVDAAIAWSFLSGGALYVHADYLLHMPLLPVFRPDYPAPDPTLPGGAIPEGLVFWTGVGGRLRLFDEARLGIRLPVGIAYLFARLPMDLFLEITPGLDLYPETSFAMSAAIGLRFFVRRQTAPRPPAAPADSV